MTEADDQINDDIELRFENPPVVEAVIDIDCELPEGFDVVSTEELARSAFGDRYPVVRKHHLHQQHISLQGASPPEISSQSALEGLRFFQEDERQLVQIRAHGYSFNRLKPYVGFDVCLDEIERTWQAYRDIVHPARVQQIRIRYINQIEIPFHPTNRRVELDDYLAIGPKLPDDDRLQMAGFLHRHQIVEPSSANRATVTLNSQPVQGAKQPEHLTVLFDIATACDLTCDPADWAAIESASRSLRDLKNLIFKRTLTPKCLDLFTPLP